MFYSATVSIHGQRKLRSDCADAQADLGFRCPYMPEVTFSHGEAHIYGIGVITIELAGIILFGFSTQVSWDLDLSF